MLPPPGPAEVAQLVTEQVPKPGPPLPGSSPPRSSRPAPPASRRYRRVWGLWPVHLLPHQHPGGPRAQGGQGHTARTASLGATVLSRGTEPPLPRSPDSHQSPQPLSCPPPRRRLPHPPLLLCVPSRPWTPWGCHAPFKTSASTALAGTCKVSPEASGFLRTNEGSNQTPPLEAQGLRLWDLEAGNPGQTGSLCSPSWGWGRKDRDPATSETPGCRAREAPASPEGPAGPGGDGAGSGGPASLHPEDDPQVSTCLRQAPPHTGPRRTRPWGPPPPPPHRVPSLTCRLRAPVASEPGSGSVHRHRDSWRRPAHKLPGERAPPGGGRGTPSSLAPPQLGKQSPEAEGER